MKGFKPMVKMQTGGTVGMGAAQPSGPMGITAPGESYHPSREPETRVGYKKGKKVKNAK